MGSKSNKAKAKRNMGQDQAKPNPQAKEPLQAKTDATTVQALAKQAGLTPEQLAFTAKHRAERDDCVIQFTETIRADAAFSSKNRKATLTIKQTKEVIVSLEPED